MINLEAYIHALKSTWIRRILNTEGIWQNLLLQNTNIYKIMLLGFKHLEEAIANQKNKFWKDVLNSWLRIYRTENARTLNLNLTPLWYNDEIKVNNCTLFYRHWYQKNIVFINDLLKEGNTFYSQDEFCEKYQIRTNFLEYEGVIRSIKLFLNKQNKRTLTKTLYPIIPTSIQLILKAKQGCKHIYQNLNIPTVNILSQNKWKMIFDD